MMFRLDQTGPVAEAAVVEMVVAGVVEVGGGACEVVGAGADEAAGVAAAGTDSGATVFAHHRQISYMARVYHDGCGHCDRCCNF